MIALLSDFQQTDYAGVVKGVIYSLNPKAQIVDLTNSIYSENILQGAWILKINYRFFPKKTIFLCVVDPGVGGKRKAIAVETKNYWFVGPDNGLMELAAKEDGIKNVYEIQPDKKWKVSITFHGRDLFAKIAAILDQGKKTNLKKINTPLIKANYHQKEREGQIVNMDTYGNIVTNIPSLEKNKYKVSYDGLEALIDVHKNYESAKEDELFILTGSNNTLEFSVKNKSALEKFEIELAKPIIGKKIKME